MFKYIYFLCCLGFIIPTFEIQTCAIKIRKLKSVSYSDTVLMI